MTRRAPLILQATIVVMASLLAGGMLALHPDSVLALVGVIAIASAALVAAGVREPAPSMCLLTLVAEFSVCLPHLDVAEGTVCAFVVAPALYALHTAAELLALIERGSEVERRVLTRAAQRVGVVSGAGILVGISMLALSKHADPAWTSVAGIVIAAVLAGSFLVHINRWAVRDARPKQVNGEAARGRVRTR